MSKKINLYYFGETGIYDEYSPAYVCGKEMVPEFLYIIACNEPFSISRKEIIEELKVDEEKLNAAVSSLRLINAIEVKEDRYKLNFSVFLDRDMPLMHEYFSKIGKVVGEKVIEKKHLIYEKISQLSSYPCFSKERLLYHVICDSIFDGTAFDFFADKNIFSPSKMQPGDRDYIIFGFEDSENVEGYSNGILCSSNNYGSESFTFNSFGDSNGIRRDMFRFLRKVLNALNDATPFKDLNLSYIKLMEDKNREIAEDCGELTFKSYKTEMDLSQLSEYERNLVDFLYKLGYLHIEKDSNKISCNVPVFQKVDDSIIKEVSEIILNDICDLVRTIFEKFEEDAAGLTAIKHKVDIKEIAIELWHQVFGFTNEYLVEIGFVESPEHKEEEGRYLRSFYVNRD